MNEATNTVCSSPNHLLTLAIGRLAAIEIDQGLDLSEVRQWIETAREVSYKHETSILWALTDCSPRPDDGGPYWWRNELRIRSQPIDESLVESMV